MIQRRKGLQKKLTKDYPDVANMKDLKKNNKLKNEKMKTTLIIGLLIGLLACQQASPDKSYSVNANKIEESEIKVSNLSEETSNQIIDGYLKIKDALVNTNSEAASYAADGLLFDFEENNNELIAKLFYEVKLIAQSEDVEQQRIYFEGLSHNIYILAKNSVTEISLYQQYCPMAFDDKGAYWISDDEEIYNPYFGEKMLRCGKVKEVID